MVLQCLINQSGGSGGGEDGHLQPSIRNARTSLVEAPVIVCGTKYAAQFVVVKRVFVCARLLV